jgi:hypothetical protein
MAENGGTQPQVRLQLTTKDAELALSELGPILVPTCKPSLTFPYLPLCLLLTELRSSTPICVVDACQQSTWFGEAGAVGVFDQWIILAHFD